IVIISDAEERSADKVFHMLERGAQDYIEKKFLSLERERDRVQEVLLKLVDKPLITEFTAPTKSRAFVLPPEPPEVILIGASTGGPQTILRLLQRLNKANLPPIVVVQHITENFLLPFAERLAAGTGLQLGAFASGTQLRAKTIYLATTRHHIGVEQKSDKLVLKTSSEGPISGHIPSVDYLFKSANKLGCKAAAVLLTGMGSD